MQCKHESTCGGCTRLDQSSAAQQAYKIAALRSALAPAEQNLEIPYYLIGPFHFRDRTDLVFSRDAEENSYLGFYQKDHRQLFNLQECMVLTKPLQNYFEKIRDISFPIKKGSLRIRSGPENNFGIWLDFANIDIKNLLDEKKILTKLLSLGEVEIGQRRKSLQNDLKLQDPKYSPWTKTWIYNGAKDLNLNSCIASFSQTGSLANATIARELNDLLKKTEGKSWVEFGAGSGTLSFALASFDNEICLTAVEFDKIAADGFSQTLKTAPELSDKITLLTGDYQNKEKIDFRSYSSVLVNPPRSGLGKFLTPLFEINKNSRPKEFIYMSCHLNSFIKDIHQLRVLNYELTDIRIIDQFPHTDHFEILSLWKLS